MFEKSQAFYDAVYSWKDYSSEAQAILKIVQRLSPGATTLLDAACGTGMHLVEFKKHFVCEGLDLDVKMLDIAAQRVPGVRLTEADLVDFDLGRQFDVVVCLFSSIGYAATVEKLHQALATLARHVSPGGLLIVEPWLTPDSYHEGHLGSLFVDRKDLKLARIHISKAVGKQSIIDFHYLVGTPDEVQSFVENHTMGLYTDEEYHAAFVAAGLQTTKEPEGPMGRGLWIGVKSAG